MRIKFVAYWNTDREIYNFINDIWNFNGDFDEILTFQNDYTHLVVLNQVHFPFKKENTFGIIMEPYWSIYFDKNLPLKCNKIVTYQPEKYPYGNSIFKPLIGTHRLYDAHYHGEIIYKPNTTKDILNTKFEKTKNLSIIINNHDDYLEKKNLHSETRYLERKLLVDKLLDSNLDFDMYGQDWKITDSRYKGFLKNKINGIKDYKYTISLENSNIPGNITEKFIDAIMCETIPIYNGHTDISKFYPNSYEYLEYDGYEIERIKEIINSNKTADDYDFKKAKELFLNEYNPIKIIKEIIENK
jgi:hypothetical protein